ncbi:bacteriocin-like protein [Flavobacterium sp. ZB4P13]
MINFKKLSREELKNVLGGQGCSIAVQESNKSWTTRQGECKQVFQNPREKSNLEIMVDLLSTFGIRNVVIFPYG